MASSKLSQESMTDLSEISIVNYSIASNNFFTEDQNALFDVAKSFVIEANISSNDAAGDLELYLQETALVTEGAPPSQPYRSFPISGGTFADGQTKQTFDSNGEINVAVVAFRFVPTDIGTGGGFITFTGHRTI